MRLILLILLIFFAVKYLTRWQGADLTNIYKERPVYLGHRGDRLNFPENTLISFRSAIDKGLDGIEMDVMLTKDGKLICSHNFDLERETTGKGFVNETDYQKLINVKTGMEFPGEGRQPIPLMMDVINSLPSTAIINIEIKTSSTFDIISAVKIARLIKKGEIKQRVIVSSFNPLALRVVKIISTSIPTGYIYSKEKNFRGFYLARPDCLHPKKNLITDKLISFCKKRNLRINTWTVNDAKSRDWLVSKSIDGIITDYPAIAQ